MNSEVFRSKEFSNRIELSQLVQDLLTVGAFGLLAALGEGGRWVWGHLGYGGAPRHVHTYLLICTHMKCYNQHVRKLQMATTMEAAMFIMLNTCMCVCTHMCAHACMCMCVCMCVGVAPHPNHHPPTPKGGSPHNQ